MEFGDYNRKSRTGAPILFAFPEELWDAAVEYFEYTDSRKWSKIDYVGKNATPVSREYVVPYTLEGLCNYLGVNVGYFSDFERSKTYKSDPGFAEVMTRIRQIIITQKKEGATLGFFDPRIVSMELGMAAKHDITSDGKPLAPTVTVVSQQAADDLKTLADENF